MTIDCSSKVWDTLEELRGRGWCVVVKALPDNMPFVIEGGRSEYDAPSDDIRVGHGKWCCELQWMRWGESPEDWYRPGTAMFGDTPEEAVAAAAEVIRDRDGND